MTMRFQPQNMSLFATVGSVHKKYSLPLLTRQKLGFLLLSAMENLIEMLIRNAFYDENGSMATDMPIDEVLDSLRYKVGGKYENLSRNQTVVRIIEKEFVETDKLVEDEIKARHQDRLAKDSLRELLHNAFTFNEQSEGDQYNGP